MKTVRVLLAGALACYALGRLAHRPVKGETAAGLLVGVAFAVMLWVRRYRRRKSLVRNLLDTAAKPLGADLKSGKVKWEGRQVQSIVVQYHAGARDTDPAVRDEVAKRMAERLDGPVSMEWVRRAEGCRFQATRSSAPRAVEPDMARLEQVATSVLGSGAVTSKLDADGPNVTAFTVRYPHTLHVTAELEARMADRLSSKTGTAWTAAWEPSRDQATFRVRPPLPTRIDYPSRKPDLAAIPVGLGASGGEVCWRPDEAAHFLAIGKTRRGKTAAMRAVIAGWVLAGGEAVIVDPKEIDYTGLAPWRGVRRLVTDMEAMAGTVAQIRSEVESRFARMRAESVGPESFTPLLLAIDEVASLFVWWRRTHHGRGEPQPIEDVEAIAMRGAGARVHLLLGIQRPEAAVLGGTLRFNTDFRLALGRLAPEERRMVGLEAGAEVTSKCKGRGLVTAPELADECQVYWLPNPGRQLPSEDRAILARLNLDGSRLAQSGAQTPKTAAQTALRPHLQLLSNRPVETPIEAPPSTTTSWLATSEAAARLGVHPSRLSQLVKAGRLHPTQSGDKSGAKLYSPVEIDALVEERARA